MAGKTSSCGLTCSEWIVLVDVFVPDTMYVCVVRTRFEMSLLAFVSFPLHCLDTQDNGNLESAV